MAQGALKKRLGMLWSVEAFNVFLLPVVTWYGLMTLGEKTDWPLWFAIAACCVLLVQGAFYWKLKLDGLVRREDRFSAWAPTFRAWSRWNSWWLGAVGLALVAGRVAQPGSALVTGATVGFYALAVAEHVNYFHWQLMHDNRADLRRLARHGVRRSQLWHDLRRERADQER